MLSLFWPPADVIQGFEELVDAIRNIYNDEIDELLDYFEDNFIGRFKEMHLVVLHRLHWIYGTCSIEQIMNSPEQTTAYKDGIAGFKLTFFLAIQCFGSF